MKGRYYFVCIIFSCIVVMKSFASERKVSFDLNWKFHRGCLSNAEQPSFDDANWRILNLPHDWSVEPAPIQREGITIGPFSKINESGAGGADTGQTLGGEGWYRKTFTINEEDADKIFTLYFEGVYNQSEVYVNGRKIYFNPYGYTSYKLDITEFCNPPGFLNTIAVRVVNVGENSRWYSGSGIYRHVWMIKTNKIHFEEWDTYVDASELNGKNVNVHFETKLFNKTGKNATGVIRVKIISPKGKKVYDESEKIAISSESELNFEKCFSIKNAELWSLESPQLYTAEILFSIQGKLLDRIEIPFGVRSISFSAQNGFQLNGKTIKLKGGCIHHDNGLLGAVAIDRAEERKVELMKANGYNAVRCAHNQVSESFLDACDRLGLLVIHETFDQWQKPKRKNDYSQFFDNWSEHDLSASLRRDRNHPSIIMWSIGNEIEQRADIPDGDIISKRLIEIIHKYDRSRFTTVAVNDFWDRPHFTWDNDAYRAFQNVDIAGYNYMWKKYESDHTKFPNRIIYGSESYPKEAAQNWNLVEKHSYIIGDFVWTAIDYLGEAGLAHTLELGENEHNPQFMGWPWYNAWCGDIDLCGDKKPQSYYRDILWGERDISIAVRQPVAIGKQEVVNGWGWTDELLSWNWPGLEDEEMRVNVYSRAPKVRLYLNKKLIGESEVNTNNYTATFKVAYKPGELKAVNVENDKETTYTTLKTTGEPSSIRLTADRDRIKDNRNDLAYVKIEIVDNDGNIVPNASIPIEIECSGNGEVIGSGNGDYDDMNSFRSLALNTFRGKALVIIQPKETKGNIKLTVSSEDVNIKNASIQIETF